MKKIITIFIAVLLFFLPWQTRLIVLPGVINGGYSEYGTISLYGTEILLWIIVILLLADFFISKRVVLAAGRRERIKLIAIFGILYLYTLFFHQNLVTLNYLWMFIEGLILFLIIRGVGESQKFTLAFVAGAAVQAVLGIYQFFTQSAFASKWLGMAAHDPSVLGTFVVETASGRWLRAYGALPHPNILAGYLVVAILIFLLLIKSNQNLPPLQRGGVGGLKKRWLYYSILMILSAGLFFTFSRGAWIALVVGMITLVIAFRRDAKFCVSTFIVPICAVFLALSAIFWPIVSARTLADSRLEIKSSTERMGYYSEAWTLIKRHPLIGVGLGNYTRAVHDEIDPSRPAYAYQPVHNIFILALAELGALGLLIIAAAMFFLRKIIPWKKAIYLAPFLIIGLFDHYLWSLYPGIILWAAYLGLIL